MLFFLGRIGLMGFMGWLCKHKFRGDDAGTNRTAQLVNRAGQACLLPGILLAG